MTEHRFVLNFRAFMLSAFRILTLLTFAAHAVLGCCMSHGDCMREQTGMLANACCDTATHVNCDVEHEKHGGHDEGETDENGHDVLDSSATCFDSQPTNHGQHRHCDDTNCAFGVSPVPTSSLNAISDGLVLWCGSLEGFNLLNRQCSGSEDPYRDRVLRPSCTRAILQVWLI